MQVPYELLRAKLSAKQLKRGVNFDQFLAAMRKVEDRCAKEKGTEPYYWENLCRQDWQEFFGERKGISVEQLISLPVYGEKACSPAFQDYVVDMIAHLPP